MRLLGVFCEASRRGRARWLHVVVVLTCALPMWFFFSSRRRHTRSLCDWSSDVCSSDPRCGSAPLFILPISCCSSAHAFYTYQFLLQQHPRFSYCPFLIAAAPHFLYCPGSRCGSAPAFFTAHFSLRHRPRFLYRSEEHTSELQSHSDLVCRLLLVKKKKQYILFCVCV